MCNKVLRRYLFHIFLECTDGLLFNFWRLFCRTIFATDPVNSTALEIVATDDDLEGDIKFEMLGSYPTTEYFDIEETGPQFANSQRLKVYIKKSLTEDPLKTHVYLVRLLTIYGQYLVPEAIILVL